MTDLADLAAMYGASKPARYLPVYEELLAPLRDAQLNVLELGIATGGSLQMWGAYLPQAHVTGLDRTVPAIGTRAVMVQGDQSDIALLQRLGDERGPFDLIIDDCSHLDGPTRLAFAVLFTGCLRPGGIYVIEDWGTGYHPAWADGQVWSPGEQPGMIRFIKDLVDAVGAPDRDEGEAVSRLTLIAGLAVVRKAP